MAEVKVPKFSTLDGFAEKSSEDPGIYVRKVMPDSVITIKTASDHFYTMKVLNPLELLVEIQGDGEWFNEPTEVHMYGSVISHAGCMAKLGWIGLGWCLELYTLEEKPTKVLTSAVKEIHIDGIKMFPMDEKFIN